MNDGAGRVGYAPKRSSATGVLRKHRVQTYDSDSVVSDIDQRAFRELLSELSLAGGRRCYSDTTDVQTFTRIGSRAIENQFW